MTATAAAMVLLLLAAGLPAAPLDVAGEINAAVAKEGQVLTKFHSAFEAYEKDKLSDEQLRQVFDRELLPGGTKCCNGWLRSVERSTASRNTRGWSTTRRREAMPCDCCIKGLSSSRLKSPTADGNVGPKRTSWRRRERRTDAASRMR